MIGRMRIAAAVAAAGVLAVVTPAAATTVTAGPSLGSPAPLDGGAGPTLPGMDVQVTTEVPDAEAPAFRVSLLAPDGSASGSGICYTALRTDHADPPYRGNGAYTVVVEYFSDAACAAPAAPAQRFGYSLSAATAVTAPSRPVLTRAPGDLALNEIDVGYVPVDGAVNYELRYARDAKLGPDGAIAGASKSAAIQPFGNEATVRLDRGGTWTLVARASDADGATPWSAPVTLRALAPFDISEFDFPDRLGPRYRIAAQVRERSARGKVTLRAARNLVGGRFRKVGSGRIGRRGVVKIRFTLRRKGAYRLRFSFNGSATTAKGSWEERVRVG